VKKNYVQSVEHKHVENAIKDIDLHKKMLPPPQLVFVLLAHNQTVVHALSLNAQLAMLVSTLKTKLAQHAKLTALPVLQLLTVQHVLPVLSKTELTVQLVELVVQFVNLQLNVQLVQKITS
jgi:hypothetical protein